MKHEIDIPENIQSQINEVKDIGKATVRAKRAEIALDAAKEAHNAGLMTSNNYKNCLESICEMVGFHLNQFMDKEE